MYRFNFKRLMQDKTLSTDMLAKKLDMPYQSVHQMIKRGTCKATTLQVIQSKFPDAATYLNYSDPTDSKEGIFINLLKEITELYEDCGGKITEVFSHIEENNKNHFNKTLVKKLKEIYRTTEVNIPQSKRPVNKSKQSKKMATSSHRRSKSNA